MPEFEVEASDNPTTALRASRVSVASRDLAKAILRDVSGLAQRALHAIRSARPRLGAVLRAAVKSAAVAAAIGAIVVGAWAVWLVRDLPLRGSMVDATNREILLEASGGQALGRVGPLSLSQAPREEFPDQLVSAVLSIEDRRFYDHWGIDAVGIVRALSRNYSSGTIVQGASTITQQLVKLRVVGNGRTLDRKLREAIAAVWLETQLSKDEILTRYLNGVYMGGGAQGLPAAAKLYFDKGLSDLTLPESALLAGLIKAPSRLNPFNDAEGARQRRDVVLDAMVESGSVTQSVAEPAKQSPVKLARQPLQAKTAPWFSDWVAQEAREISGAFSGTMRMRTTLDPALQELAERAVANGLASSSKLNVSQAALVAMRPDGSVVAMVGGRDYSESQFNRAVQARRQAGSAFKLFVYLAALRKGYAPNDLVDASSLSIGDWEPENFGGRTYGRVSLAEAFARSINTAAVHLAQDVGLDNVIKVARELGIQSPLPKVPSLALGSADVSLLELTAAYASILARRSPVQPWAVNSFLSPTNGRTMEVGSPSGSRRALGKTGEEMLRLLTLPVERGTAQRAALAGFAAGKTGTTQNHKDAWFIGFNESLVVGVWVGNDDGSPMRGVTGGSLPATIWQQFMRAASARSVVSSKEPTSTRPQLQNSFVFNFNASTDRTLTDDASSRRTSMDQEYVHCDVNACAAKYHSFRVTDCTYQPLRGGPRTRCEAGSSSGRRASSSFAAGMDSIDDPSLCNYGACARAYSSFRPTDCTYQPFDGGSRRMCSR